MNEPTERDRELLAKAKRDYHERWLSSSSFTGWDYGDSEVLAALTAAREEGRQEERARCRDLVEQWEAFDGRWCGRPMHEVDIQFRILHEIGIETGTRGGVDE